MTTSPPRIEGIVAREANVAVIFRRGPTRYTQMLVWNLDTDEVVPGQWIRARVNVRACDVSPDGRLLVAGLYDAGNRRESGDTHSYVASGWTAISRPPYFTALALWFDQYGDGGSWESSRAVRLASPAAQDPPDKGAVPKRIRRLPASGSPSRTRFERDGWRRIETARHIEFPKDRRSDAEIAAALTKGGVVDDPASITILRGWDVYARSARIGATRWERSFLRGTLVRVEGGGRFDGGETLLLCDEAGQIRKRICCETFSWAWMDLDARGRVIYSEDGGLWAWADFPNGAPTRIVDLNANRFEPVVTPEWAREWPSDAPPEW